MHIHLYMYTHVYIYIYIHISIHVHIYIYIYSNNNNNNDNDNDNDNDDNADLRVVLAEVLRRLFGRTKYLSVEKRPAFVNVPVNVFIETIFGYRCI